MYSNVEYICLATPIFAGILMIDFYDTIFFKYDVYHAFDDFNETGHESVPGIPWWLEGEGKNHNNNLTIHTYDQTSLLY